MSERLDTFRLWIKEQASRPPLNDEDIARVFFAITRHISVEELYSEVRQVNPRWLCDRLPDPQITQGVRTCRGASFCRWTARFENIEAERHHDHLICERCGRIIEFVQPRLKNSRKSLPALRLCGNHAQDGNLRDLQRMRESLDPHQGRFFNG